MTIEVTEEMLEAALDRLNELSGEQGITCPAGVLAGEIYIAMETTRRRRIYLDAVVDLTVPPLGAMN